MRIGIVNDLPMAIECLRRVILAAPGLEIAWVAYNGREAVRHCVQDLPDLILMDLVMPEMDGVQATRLIMKSTPCPILIVTASVTNHCALVFEAMGAGALDAVATPVIMAEDTGMKNGIELLEKIFRIGRLSGAPAVSQRLRSSDSSARGVASRRKFLLLAIGASTGGPQALVKILSSLPADFPGAVAIIQHMDDQFMEGLTEWLKQQCNLRVQILRSGDAPKPGGVYLPRTLDHVVISTSQVFRYANTPEDSIHRPSIDVFFQSVADNWDGACIGVLLTGMGRDGAEGLLALRKKGFLTIAQDESTSVVFGMPRAACQIGAVSRSMPIEDIGPAILDTIGRGK